MIHARSHTADPELQTRLATLRWAHMHAAWPCHRAMLKQVRRLGQQTERPKCDHLFNHATAVAASTTTTTAMAHAPGATWCRASRSITTTGRRTPRR